MPAQGRGRESICHARNLKKFKKFFDKKVDYFSVFKFDAEAITENYYESDEACAAWIYTRFLKTLCHCNFKNLKKNVDFWFIHTEILTLVNCLRQHHLRKCSTTKAKKEEKISNLQSL